MATTMGGRVQSVYKYPSGRLGIRWAEQFTRLSDSSLNLAHTGRVKDIPESVRMLRQLYPKGLPKHIGFNMSSFEKTANFLYQRPVVMPSTPSNIFYGKSLDNSFKNMRTGFYKKTMGWKFKKNLSKMGVTSGSSIQKTPSFNVLPPSPSFSPSTIFSPVYSGNFVGSNVRKHSPSFKVSSVSTSISMPSLSTSSSIPSISKNVYYNMSKGFSSTSKSIDRSLSSSVVKPSSSMVSSFSSSSSSKSSSFSSMSSSLSSSPYFGLYPKLPKGLRGRGGFGWKDYGKRMGYGFRQFKVPSLKKILGGKKLL